MIIVTGNKIVKKFNLRKIIKEKNYFKTMVTSKMQVKKKRRSFLLAELKILS